MARIVTLGEIMLRLKSPALERFFQSPSLEATFGGGEANVAVSLANYGMDAAFVTALPNNAIGEACLRDVRSFGVDVSNIKMMDGRMGIYFLETGSNQRPSKVVYDRADSCIAKAPVDTFDWKDQCSGTGSNNYAVWFLFPDKIQSYFLIHFDCYACFLAAYDIAADHVCDVAFSRRISSKTHVSAKFICCFK